MVERSAVAFMLRWIFPKRDNMKPYKPYRSRKIPGSSPGGGIFYLYIIMRDLLKPLNRLNRELMKLIDKDYLSKKLGKRRGNCLKCGECCKKCKFLDAQTKLCKVYYSRPWICHKDFPLDKKEQWIWNTKQCGYYFEKKQ